MLITSQKSTLPPNTQTQPTDITVDEYVRWLCLCDAINAISSKAIQLSVDPDKYVSKKSSNIKRYIDEVFPSARANFILGSKIKFN